MASEKNETFESERELGKFLNLAPAYIQAAAIPPEELDGFIRSVRREEKLARTVGFPGLAAFFLSMVWGAEMNRHIHPNASSVCTGLGIVGFATTAMSGNRRKITSQINERAEGRIIELPAESASSPPERESLNHEL